METVLRKTEGCTCQNCGDKYQVDLIIPDELWEKISPRKVEGFKGGGLLCPKCIGSKLESISDYDCFKLIQMDDYQKLISDLKEPIKQEGDLKTESEWIEHFRSKGFELYKTEDLKPKLEQYYKQKD